MNTILLALFLSNTSLAEPRSDCMTQMNLQGVTNPYQVIIDSGVDWSTPSTHKNSPYYLQIDSQQAGSCVVEFTRTDEYSKRLSSPDRENDIYLMFDVHAIDNMDTCGELGLPCLATKDLPGFSLVSSHFQSVFFTNMKHEDMQLTVIEVAVVRVNWKGEHPRGPIIHCASGRLDPNVKGEPQVCTGTHYSLEILEWKWVQPFHSPLGSDDLVLQELMRLIRHELERLEQAEQSLEGVIDAIDLDVAPEQLSPEPEEPTELEGLLDATP